MAMRKVRWSDSPVLALALLCLSDLARLHGACTCVFAHRSLARPEIAQAPGRALATCSGALRRGSRITTVSLRAERLVADNTLTGAAAATLGEGAGLLSEDGHTPERFSLSWLYQWRPQIEFRAEYISDQTLPEEQDRFAVGVVWQGSLLSGHAGH